MCSDPDCSFIEWSTSFVVKDSVVENKIYIILSYNFSIFDNSKKKESNLELLDFPILMTIKFRIDVIPTDRIFDNVKIIGHMCLRYGVLEIVVPIKPKARGFRKR